MKKSSSAAAASAVAALLALLFIVPVLITFTGSLLSTKYITSNYLTGTSGYAYFFPPLIVLDQYYHLLIDNAKYTHLFMNSFILATGIALANVFLAALTAYPLSKIKFAGRGLLVCLYCFMMIMPFQVTLLQNFLLAKWLKLYDTWWALFFPGVVSPLGVVLMMQFLKHVPLELFESARLETKNTAVILFRVIFPTVKSGLLVLFILVFSDAWNMVEQPLVLISNVDKYPLSVALNTIMSEDPASAFAGCVIYILPVLILFALFKDNILDSFGGIVQ